MTEPQTLHVMLEGSLRFLRTVERLNLVFTAAAALAVFAVVGIGPFLWGVLAGGALGALNFRGMIWLGGRILATAHRSRALYAALFATKLAALGAAVWAILSLLPVTTLGFLLGISMLLPAVMVTSLREGRAGHMAPLHGGQEG